MRLLAVGMVLVLLALGVGAETLTLSEQFGISHPDQIVFFTPATPVANPSLTDDAGKPVPCQCMADGRIAVRTDLPAGATKRWTLREGGKPLPAAVAIVRQPGYTEIVNDLVGIRIPTVPADLTTTPAPIQGILLRDGTWTAVGPNAMARPAKSMQVEILDQGPLVVRAKVSYVYASAEVRSHRDGVKPIPAGDYPYTITVEVQAGQPSILFEEDCQTDIAYKVNLTGFDPDTGQYRGHHANDPASGHEPNGAVYAYGNTRHDALVNLDYARGKDRWSQTSYPYASHWDPWGVDTGFYWQLYRAAPGGNDNLVGIFAGPTSRLINPGVSGVSFDTATVNGQRVAGLQVRFQRLMPTQYLTARMRFDWGLFLGKKSADVKPPYEVQGINRQMNIHAGINLTTLAPLPTEYPDLAGGYGNLYAPASAWKAVADKLREEKAQGGKAYYSEQYNANPYLKGILDYWASPSAETAGKAADEVNASAKNYLDTQVNGEGIYQHATHYFMGASGMASYLLWADILMSTADLAPDKKAQLKRSMALFATALWDDDVTPTQLNSGQNMGPANMWSMWTGTRSNFTLFLAEHPQFKLRAKAIKDEALTLLHDYTNEAGACTASAHYTGASMVPILNLLAQLQSAKVFDAYATSPRLPRYAEWEMQLMTPPEVRFGGLRKIIAVGDGSTEQSTRPGILGTGFRNANPELSKRLMGAWQAMGRPQDNFFGPSLLKIDPTLPAVSPTLGDADFPGWMTVLRQGWDTPDESACFFVNGDTLSDHRHNDNGTLVLYALGAPLSVDWGSIYYPRPSGGLMHSIALPESHLPCAWTAAGLPLDLPSAGYSTWWNTVHEPLRSFRDSAVAAATFSTGKDMQWRRELRFFRSDPAHPVIMIDDRFTGAGLAGKPVISTLNLMAQGAVQTPAGPVTPEERTHTPDQKTTPEKLPSGGKPFDLAAGLNQFGFTGQWLIDWDLYTDCDTPLQAAVGNWGNTWIPSTELGQFRKAQGKPYEERQHILRLRGSDRIRTLILPYRKGERPNPCAVERMGDALVVREGDGALIITDAGCAAAYKTRKSLVSYGADPVEGLGMRVSGGPVEVVLDGKAGTLTVLGAPGARTVILPAGWTPAKSTAVTAKTGVLTVSYNGGAPLVVALTGK
jgi:hypothetical protein